MPTLTDTINKAFQEEEPPVKTTNTPKIRCKICGQTGFARNSDLASHVRLTHKRKQWIARMKEIHAARRKAKQLTASKMIHQPVIAEKANKPLKIARNIYTPAQYQLAKEIMADPQWAHRNGRGVNWGAAFSVHPEWRTQLNYDENSDISVARFSSFVQRVRAGKTGKLFAHITMNKSEPIKAESNNGTVYMIGGKEFQLAELEVLVKAGQMRHLLYCPECGYNLRMHTQAYNIARRHQQEG